MPLLARLRSRLKSASSAFTDPELQELLDTAITDYGLREGQDNRVILDLSLALAYLELATDTARYHKWSEADLTVDQTTTPDTYLELYKLTWARIAEALPASAPTPTGLQPDTAVLARTAQDEAEASEA